MSTPAPLRARTSVGEALCRVTEARLITLLRWSAFFCFLGWAWQHLRWDAPYREILWSPERFGWVLDALGYTWESYVGSVTTDRVIARIIQAIGILYVGFAGLCWMVRRRSSAATAGLALGSAMLFLLAYCMYLDHMHYFAQWIEYAAQIGSPVLLLVALRWGSTHPITLETARVAIVLTFFGHGLYALGFFPTPGSFYTMTMTILGVGDVAAGRLLWVAGLLDLLLCLGIFVPKARRFFLGYAALWGLLTALARPVAGMRWFYPWWGADQYLHELMYRVPHFLLPLFLLLAFRALAKAREAPSSRSTDARARVGVDASLPAPVYRNVHQDPAPAGSSAGA